jgi:hypothetical protein
MASPSPEYQIVSDEVIINDFKDVDENDLKIIELSSKRPQSKYGRNSSIGFNKSVGSAINKELASKHASKNYS